jgi:hypothetical protein
MGEVVREMCELLLPWIHVLSDQARSHPLEIMAAVDHAVTDSRHERDERRDTKQD